MKYNEEANGLILWINNQHILNTCTIHDEFDACAVDGPKLVYFVLYETTRPRPYVIGFSMPLNGHEQSFGMSTSMMASLHNSTSTYADPLVNASSPLQGSGVNNLGRS